MSINKLAPKYAQAVYELAQEQNRLAETEKELVTVAETIHGHSELNTLIYHPRVPAAAKKETIEKVFKAELSGFVQNFLLLLIDKRRERALPAIIKEYQKLANKARNILQAEVTTALPMSEHQEQVLSNKLSKLTGKSVVFKTNIDKDILGGVIIKIGDKRIDGSVARQIKTLGVVLQNP